MVKVVHCIDAEGPVEETPEVRAELTSRPCYATWAEVEDSLVVANGHRSYYSDTQGRAPRLSWFIADNVGWIDNPRRKATGQHAVYDRIMWYVGMKDSVGWHCHALSPRRRALEYSTTWTTHLGIVEETLCRRLLERGTFPATFRAGGAIMRPDLAAWLDLFIPFDYSPHPDIGGPGEQMDWRRWNPGKRVQVVTAELDSITYQMGKEDLELSFLSGDGLVAYAGHDRRSVLDDLRRAHALITKVAAGRPWQWANAQEALRPNYTPVKWTVKAEGPVTYLSANTAIYGHPFLAVQDGAVVYRDNPTREDERVWAFKPPKGARVAVAAWPAL